MQNVVFVDKLWPLTLTNGKKLSSHEKLRSEYFPVWTELIGQ